MSKKTYELCFDVEGLRIIPIGEDQVSVQILSEESDPNILAEREVGILQESDTDALFLSQSQSILDQDESLSTSRSPAPHSPTPPEHSTAVRQAEVLPGDKLGQAGRSHGQVILSSAATAHLQKIHPHQTSVSGIDGRLSGETAQHHVRLSSSSATSTSSPQYRIQQRSAPEPSGSSQQPLTSSGSSTILGHHHHHQQQQQQQLPGSGGGAAGHLHHLTAASVPLVGENLVPVMGFGSSSTTSSSHHDIHSIEVEKLPQQLFNTDAVMATSKQPPPQAQIRLAHHKDQLIHPASRQNEADTTKVSRQPISLKKDVLPPIGLCIEYGSAWVDDLLCGMSTDWKTTSDFPVYCADGIAWTSRVIIGSLNAHLRNLLLEADEDSCLVIPQISKEEFDTFMEFILKKVSEFNTETVGMLLKVGEIFDFPIRYISFDSQMSDVTTVDYDTIFNNQKDEFIHRICKQTELAKTILDRVKVPGSFHQRRHDSTRDINQELDPFKLMSQSYEPLQGFECEACGRVLPSEEALETHNFIVHDPTYKQPRKSYRCPQCDKKFSFEENVSKHLFLVHSKFQRSQVSTEVESPPPSTEFSLGGQILASREQQQVRESELSVVCKICGISCKNRRALVAHNQKHYGKLHQCQVEGCGRRFTESSKLRRHMVVHTKEKNFECPICMKRFTLLQNLKSHLKNHHKLSRTELNTKLNAASSSAGEKQKAQAAVLSANTSTDGLDQMDVGETVEDIKHFMAAMQTSSAQSA